MRSGPGGADGNGVYQFGEADDPDGTFSGLMALLTGPLSTLIGNLLKPGLRGVAHGSATAGSQTVITAANTWMDVATLAVTTKGLACTYEVGCALRNAGSGATRQASIRVLLDGVVVGSQRDYELENNGELVAYDVETSTPSAGAHTVKLQAASATANAFTFYAGVLTVREG